MRNYWSFAHKEIIEGIRTHKTIILLTVFLLFGIMSPLFAKLTPEILLQLGGEGLSISVPDPTAIDSWAQFFKNISLMGLIVVVVLFSGIISLELSNGTLIILLTKGLSRTTVILAKYSIALLIWTVAYALCFVVTLGYTVFLFPDNNAENLVFAVMALWLYGVLLLSFLVFAAAALKSNYACLLATGLFAVVLTLIGIIPATQDYNPLSLSSSSGALMMGALDPATLLPALIIATVGSLVCLAAAVLVFRKRQL